MNLDTITPEQLQADFAYLDDWETRYGHVIDMGKALPPFPVEQQNSETLVRGCTSQVWIIPQSAEEGHIAFIGDSDAHIVRGLIAILYCVYNNKHRQYVKEFPIEPFFAELGLAEHLTPNRRSGFFAMVERIKQLAS